MGWDWNELFAAPSDGADGKDRRNGTPKNGKLHERAWQQLSSRRARRRRRNLITGGAGFIGSHLADELVERGEEVFVIDNLSTGSIENIEHLKAKPNFHYVIDTIANEPLMAELVDRCDVIYHLAATVGVELIVRQPVKTIQTNIYGTEVVLRLAARKRKRVILASTSEIYGKNHRLPFREEDVMVFGPTTKHRWAYACTKAIDEFLALAYHHEYGLPVTILRFFNTVGPRQVGTYGMVVPRFVRAALRGEPLRIFGDGLQTRCFSYVGDIVKAAVKVAGSPHTVGEVYNVGSDEEISIAELAERVVALCGSDSPIVHVPYEEAYGDGFEDMRRRVPDLSKIRQAIGYKPAHSLNDILKLIIAYESQTVPV